MKKYITLVLLICAVTTSYAQLVIENQKSTQPPPPPIIKGCEDAENRHRCAKKKLRDAAFEFLKPTDIQKVIDTAENDTIFMNTLLYFDADKNLILEKSSLKFHKSEMKTLAINVTSPIEKIPFNLSPESRNYKSKFRSHLFLKIDRENKKLIPLYDYKPKRRLFSGPDTFAIYPGCESASTFQKQKKCFAASLNKHIGENFNTELASNLDLNGIIRMFAAFTIDTEGNIVNLRIRAPHPALGREVKRVIKLLSTVTPASLEGIPVKIPYTLPIMFKIQ